MPSTPRQPNPIPGGTDPGSDRASSVPDHLKVLGDFELSREIGRGGMGTVYEARQRSLKRIVALKVLSAQASASPTVVERFLREAQAAAKLHHTHIVPIFAQGEEKGVYFYAMELVEGHSLHAIITSARRRQVADTATVDINETVVLPRSSDARKTSTQPRSGSAQSPGENDSAVSLPDPLGTCSTAQRCAAIAAHIADVADGLDYAHRHGVIHRDIKPHNLMLGDDGRLRIADFGLARLSEQAGVTMTGEMLGSPMYMAPEQILEGPGQIDARVDLYALGVTLYEWLALRPPFPGETRERVLRLILSADAPSLRSLNPDIPPAIETICAKAMSRDRRARYQTAGAFRDDLRRFLADEPILARQVGVFARTRRFFQRHQVGSLTALAGVFAVALGWSLLSSKTPVARETTVAQSAQAVPSGDQNGTNGSAVDTDQLLAMLRTAWPAEFGALSGGAGIAAPVMEDIVRVGQELSVMRDRSPKEVADSFTLGTPMGITQRAAPNLYESMVRPDWPPAADDPDDGFAQMLIGANELRRTNPASALQFVDMFVQNRSEDFDARQLRAALSAQMGYYDQFAQDAEALVRLGNDRASAYIWRGLSQLLSRHAEAGLVDFAHALELEPDSSWAATLRGLALLNLNKASEAIQTFDQAVKSAPDLILALLGRAAAYAATGSMLDAVSDLTRVLQLRPNDADALTMRGDYNAALGRYADASQDFENAIEVAGDTPALFFRLMLARSQHNTQLGQPPAKMLAPVSPRTPDADATRPEASNGTSSRLPVECMNQLTLRRQRPHGATLWHGRRAQSLKFASHCLRWP